MFIRVLSEEVYDTCHGTYMEIVYDNVSSERVWKVLGEYGMKGRLLSTIWALLSLKVGEMESKLFGVHRGVWQGTVPYLHVISMCLHGQRR